MENVVLYIVLGALCVCGLAFLVANIVKFCKMSAGDKREVLITYLQGLVVWAEQQIGAGHGAEKLAQVEEYFKKNAPRFYRIVLSLVGKDNLKELIELALERVKENFSK